MIYAIMRTSLRPSFTSTTKLHFSLKQTIR